MEQDKGIYRKVTRGLAIKKKKLLSETVILEKSVSLLQENIKTLSTQTPFEKFKKWSSHCISIGKKKIKTKQPSPHFTNQEKDCNPRHGLLHGTTPCRGITAVQLHEIILTALEALRTPEQHCTDTHCLPLSGRAGLGLCHAQSVPECLLMSQVEAPCLCIFLAQFDITCISACSLN